MYDSPRCVSHGCVWYAVVRPDDRQLPVRSCLPWNAWPTVMLPWRKVPLHQVSRCPRRHATTCANGALPEKRSTRSLQTFPPVLSPLSGFVGEDKLKALVLQDRRLSGV